MKSGEGKEAEETFDRMHKPDRKQGWLFYYRADSMGRNTGQRRLRCVQGNAAVSGALGYCSNKIN